MGLSRSVMDLLLNINLFLSLIKHYVTKILLAEEV
jgi:hypothetical protein